MPFHEPGSRDWRANRRIFLRLIAPLAVAFCAAILLVRHNGKSVWKLVSDPTAALHASPLLGFFSNLGILGWCTGAAVALFAAWVLARGRAPRPVVRFHLGAGLFTALLMVDDFFLIHDALAPRYLHLSQNAVYAVYALAFAGFITSCRRELRARNPALFTIAVGLLGFMAGIDAMVSGYSRYVSLAMSGSKFLGIACWSAWLVLNAQRDLEAAQASGEP